MKIIPAFKSYVEQGKLLVKDPSFKTYLSQLKDGEYYLTLKKKHKTRSLQQNAYLWGVVYSLIADHTGMLPEEVHDHCKMRFLQKNVGKFQTLQSTTQLNKLEFGEYLDKVMHWSLHDLGVLIPEPYTVEN